MTINVSFYEISDIGKRPSNQDALKHWVTPNACCFVVADGLGGHQHGEVASTYLCDAFIHEAPFYASDIYDNQQQGLQRFLRKSSDLMQQHILAEHGNIDTHTTFALVWLDDKQLLTAHVGDSRIYCVKQDAVIWRTPDHSAVQPLFEEGKITDDEMGSHPLQNQLLKTVNTREYTQPDIFSYPPLAEDETLILCTDGFWGPTPLAEMVRLAKRSDIADAISQRVQQLVLNPFSDNVTAQVVKLI